MESLETLIERKASPVRGRAVRKMEKPYRGRTVAHTCSNGWTIERVIEEEFGMEAFFMGHCLSLRDCGGLKVWSLREPDGTPHATIVEWDASTVEFVGRCNQPPVEKYMVLLREYFEAAAS